MILEIILSILNYGALGLLFIGCAYMHCTQKLNFFVYFCYIISTIIFIIYAIYLFDIYVFIQNSMFLSFDAVGVIQMKKVKKNGHSNSKVA